MSATRVAFLRPLLSSSAFRFALGALISLAALYLAGREVNLALAQYALSQVSLQYLLLAVLSVGVNTIGKTARWRVLLGKSGQGIPVVRLLMALLTGQLLNTLLPVRMGDLSRAYDIGGLGPGRVFVLGGVVIEKVIDTLCLALLALALIVLAPLPAWLTRSTYFLVAIAAVATVVIVVLVYRLDWISTQLGRLSRHAPDRLNQMFLNRMKLGIDSMHALRQDIGWLELAASTLVVWGTSLATNQLLLLAFHIELPLTAACLLLVVLLIGITIPSLPAGIGLFEYLCVLSLGGFAVENTLALTYGIVLHLLTVMPMFLAGPAYLLNIRKPNQQPTQSL